MTEIEMRKAAKAFSEYWQGKGYEKGESQAFWLSSVLPVSVVPSLILTQLKRHKRKANAIIETKKHLRPNFLWLTPFFTSLSNFSSRSTQ